MADEIEYENIQGVIEMPGMCKTTCPHGMYTSITITAWKVGSASCQECKHFRSKKETDNGIIVECAFLFNKSMDLL